MRKLLPLSFAIAALLAGGCTWVHLAPGAQAVKVLPLGAEPPGCEKRGDVAVSVKDSVAFYERNELRVREELETLARNEGPGMGADTIQPLGPPVQGEQRFAGYRCGNASALLTPVRPAPREGAETFPLQG